MHAVGRGIDLFIIKTEKAVSKRKRTTKNNNNNKEGAQQLKNLFFFLFTLLFPPPLRLPTNTKVFSCGPFRDPFSLSSSNTHTPTSLPPSRPRSLYVGPRIHKNKQEKERCYWYPWIEMTRLVLGWWLVEISLSRWVQVEHVTQLYLAGGFYSFVSPLFTLFQLPNKVERGGAPEAPYQLRLAYTLSSLRLDSRYETKVSSKEIRWIDKSKPMALLSLYTYELTLSLFYSIKLLSSTILEGNNDSFVTQNLC